MSSFGAGITSGATVSILALVAASLIAPQPAGISPPEMPQTDLSAQATAPRRQVIAAPHEIRDLQPSAPQDTDISNAPVVQNNASDAVRSLSQPVAGPQPAPLPLETTAPAPQPDADFRVPHMAVPEAQQVDRLPQAESPVTESRSLTLGLTQPQTDQTLIINDQPQQPPLPDIVEAAAFSSAASTYDLDTVAEFAAPFSSDGRPMLAVIWVAPSAALRDEMKRKVSFDGASIAIPLGDRDRAVQSILYRAMGAEVLLLPDLSEASLQAVELQLSNALRDLPQSIGILETRNRGLGDDDAIVRNALERLSSDGRVLITVGDGLQRTERAAESLNIPTLRLFGDLDGAGQTEAEIKRLLSQAAQQASTTSAQGVAVVLRMRPQTLRAMEQWQQGQFAERVQIAPVSALFK